MEGLLVLVATVVVGVLLLAPILSIIALVRSGELTRGARRLQERLGELEDRLHELERQGGSRPAAAAGAAAAATPATAPAAQPARPAPEAEPPTPARPPAPAAPETPAPPPAAGPPPATAAPPALPDAAPGRSAAPPAALRAPARRSSPVPAREPRGDFATELGPRILVTTGALAFVVFLGLFVRLVWENDWIGPAGRVMLGALMGLALLATGLRLMRRELRPLGQGLAASGLAGLFVAAFASYGVYQLVPRGFAGFLMLVITACAVILAERLDARLFAAIGWFGAYLTPAMLATGEDRALALFAYLALLNAGALVLDHRRPWPETLPLAASGTMVLYLGWYASHISAERFAVAAVGLVLFTAQFALGAAHKQRSFGMGGVLLLSALGLTLLAPHAEPWSLAVLSLALAGAGLALAARLGAGLALISGLAVGLPLLVWSVSLDGPLPFAVAALWLLGAGALFAGIAPPRLGGLPPEAGAVVLGGLAAAALAATANRPLATLGLLLGQGLVAVLARRRWRWAEAAGVATGALAVLAWLEAHYRVGREREALTLAGALAAAWLLALLGRAVFERRIAEWPEVTAHLATAALAWLGFERVLRDGPWLGPVAAALAALYLLLGVVLRSSLARDSREPRTLLGLASAFLALAIPAQLGLYGITLGWSLQGVLLLALGTRFRSALARAGGYALLGAGVVRLLAWHLPLHSGDFRPLFNPVFGTWLAVVALLGLALRLTRPARAAGASLDRALGPPLAALALLLLLGVLTGETSTSFAQSARLAREAGDLEAARAASFRGPLAVSALWASFATALLGAGLALRARPLFYAGYALFGLTGAKLLLVDLASLQTLYRMLSFLVLGLLLMAGAWLNLRFRARLLPSGEAS